MTLANLDPAATDVVLNNLPGVTRLLILTPAVALLALAIGHLVQGAWL